MIHLFQNSRVSCYCYFAKSNTIKFNNIAALITASIVCTLLDKRIHYSLLSLLVI